MKMILQRFENHIPRGRVRTRMKRTSVGKQKAISVYTAARVAALSSYDATQTVLAAMSYIYIIYN